MSRKMESIAVGVVILSGLLAFGLLFFGGLAFDMLQGSEEPLYLFAQSFPYLGVAIVVGMSFLFYYERNRGREYGSYGSTEKLGESSSYLGKKEQSVEDAMGGKYRVATSGQYIGRSTLSEREIYECLESSAVRALKSNLGLSDPAATDAVESGDWSEDPVAAGFLSQTQPYPRIERLYAAFDPGRAFQRRVERTIEAVESLEAGDVPPALAEASDNEASQTETTDSQSIDGPTPETDGSATDSEGQTDLDRLIDGDQAVEKELQTDGGTPRVAQKRESLLWPAIAAVLFAGVGIAAGSRLLLIAATLPLWYAAFESFSDSPSTTVSVSREITIGDTAVQTNGTEPLADGGQAVRDTTAAHAEADTQFGDPGDTVTVRTTVENVGDSPVVDLRVRDGVPSSLEVTDSSAEQCVSLAVGERKTYEYEIELRRGEHVFGPADIRTRDMTGIVSKTWTEQVGGDGRIECVPTVDNVPLDSGTNDYAGRVPSDEEGAGVEFYSVREYQPGDSIRSIDWRRYAATRELSTVEYRAERATRIVCAVDARRSQLETPTDSAIPTVSLSADAAHQTFETLLGEGHPTGVVGLYGGKINDELAYVPSGTDAETRQCASELLETIRAHERPEDPYIGSRSGDHATELERLLSGETQVFLFTSMADSKPVDLVETLTARGYTVHVISPNVTGGAETAPARLERLSRNNRLTELRRTGAHVVDWDLGRPLELVISEALQEVNV